MPDLQRPDGSVDWEYARGASRTQVEPPPGWPAGVRTISIEGMTLLGVDDTGLLYWDGKPVEVRRRLDLSRGEQVFALAVGFFTILGAIGAMAQGWATAHQWSCQIKAVDWYCPRK